MLPKLADGGRFMTRRWMILAVLMMVALPSVLYGRWIKDKVYLQTDSVGKVEFSHFAHMEMESIGKNCPTCHNEAFHIVTKKNPAFTMAEMESGKSCGFCHNDTKAFGVGGDCTTCHAGDVEINYGIAEKVMFSHDVHADMFGCDECHSDLFVPERNSNQVGMKKMEEGESCGACHDGDSAFSVKSDCSNCHTSAGAIAMQSPVGEILFSHDVHTGAFGCDECHSDIFKAKANSNQVGMKKMEDGESCGACHDGDSAFSVSGDCVTCHSNAADMAIQAKDVNAVPFSHTIHTEMLGCAECHPDIFVAKANSNQVGMQRMEAGESCGACHDGDTAFGVGEDCTTCHLGDFAYTKDIPIQSPVGGIVFSHVVHTEMFGCDECHPETFRAKANSTQVGMKKMESGESCGACHDGDSAFSVKADCRSCHQGAEDIPIQSTVGAIVFSHDAHIEMFGCDECHPDTFKAKANSNQVGMKKMEAGESCGTCHDGDTAFGVAGDCVTCHSNAADVAIQAQDVGAVPFSHDVHTEMFGCGECHPDLFVAQANSNQVGMTRMEDGESCGACHDGDTAFGVGEACATCHTGSLTYTKNVAIKSGVWSILFSHKNHTENFSCGECHPDVFRAKANSNQVGMKKMEDGASCGACHNGEDAFSVTGDCAECHASSVDVAIQTKNVGTIPFSHAEHGRMFACDECHPDTFKAQANSNQVGMKKMEDGASCGACHDGRTAFGVKGDCSTCHSGAVDVAMQSTVGAIVFSHEVHTEDFGCDECHPDIFEAKANSTQVGMKKMESGESCGSCHDGSTAFGVAGDCITCHTKAVDVAIQTKNVGVAPFSHSVHTEMFGCSECHPDLFRAQANSNQVGMQAMESGASCGACHDGGDAFSVKEDCTSCHAGDVVYQAFGKTIFSHAKHLDKFGCDECHPRLFQARRGANKVATMDDMEIGQSCGACHNGGKAFGVENCDPCHIK